MCHIKLTIKNLSIEFNNVSLLEDVNFECKSGETVSISGEVGSGKSSLLNVLGLLAKPSAGQIYLYDSSTAHEIDYLSLPRAEQDEFIKHYFAYIFHEPKLMPNWNIIDNISLPLIAKGKTKHEVEETVQNYCKFLGIDKFSKFKKKESVSALSAGERKLVGIARALVKEPKILIADEPFSNFDEKTRVKIAEKWVELAKEKNMMIIEATHFDLGLFDTRYIIDNKNLIEDFTEQKTTRR
jgi:ABC-type lipoprotein export system ATPase subunit